MSAIRGTGAGGAKGLLSGSERTRVAISPHEVLKVWRRYRVSLNKPSIVSLVVYP